VFDDGGRLVVRGEGIGRSSVDVHGSGSFVAGGIEVDVRIEDHDTDVTLKWAITNNSGNAVAIDAVAFEWNVPCGAEVRWFANGYQSWSPTGARVLGVDHDPSRHPNGFSFVRAVHHADPAVAAEGELRSEQVSAVDLGLGTGAKCIGFDGGSHHSGTIRARRSSGGVLLTVEAWLGGALLPPGAQRPLHGIHISSGTDVPALLDAWAARAGANEHARVSSPYEPGWCSWYQYFHDVTQAAIVDNLARAGDWPFTVFQVDDGYQRDIGDWLETNERFPAGVDGVAAEIARHGYTPGLWLAPFIALPTSTVATAHPDWFARQSRSDDPLPGMYHEVWGGVMWQLDTTRDDVQEHLASTARTLVEMGYRYLKLDFTFSPAMPGRFADPTRTPAERVRAGYDAVRSGAGDGTFILGCGCPLGAVVGVVDAMRIGPDVAPWWDVTAASNPLPGYDAAAPATRNAWVSTLARSFMHRRLWANDPDCLMLRTADTALSPGAARAWAYAVALSGGLALVSDDLALLGDDARALLDDVLALGRAADGAARSGPAPRCDDILDPGGPRSLSAAGTELRTDPADPRPIVTKHS
jgi:alpha-galactosidase